jgi:hypothetical protein
MGSWHRWGFLRKRGCAIIRRDLYLKEGTPMSTRLHVDWKTVERVVELAQSSTTLTVALAQFPSGRVRTRQI